MSPKKVFSKGSAVKMLRTTGLVISVIFSSSFSKTDVPLFLFSGQSNMVCLGSAISGLPAEDRSKTYNNIKIHNRSDNASSKWSTLKPGFGADANHFGPELYFGKVLMDSMPNTKFAFIKDATSGTYLGKSDGWLSPSSGGPGTLYKNMMTHIDNALKEFKDAYDTSLYAPKWAGFVWLQGEFDGMDQNLAKKYEENLTNLIKDIRAKAKADSMPVVIPMINQTTMAGMKWQYIDIIHAAEIAVTVKLSNCDTTQIKNFKYTDNVHYDAASMLIIGTNCAKRWLAMKYLDVVVPVINMRNNISSVTPSSVKSTTSFDLTGRKIMQLPAGVDSKLDRPVNIIINVDGKRAEKVLPVDLQ